jgi:hypothetical protein
MEADRARLSRVPAKAPWRPQPPQSASCGHKTKRRVTMTMNTYAETALYRKPLHPAVMERAMINWPEMPRHAED